MKTGAKKTLYKRRRQQYSGYIEPAERRYTLTREELVTPTNAAEMAGVSRARINELMRNCRITTVRIDGRPFVVRQSLIVWMRARANYAQARSH